MTNQGEFLDWFDDPEEEQEDIEKNAFDHSFDPDAYATVQDHNFHVIGY